ncbi:MAG: hypothetical protein R2828_03840 [Saprospiraceae bacterium]
MGLELAWGLIGLLLLSALDLRLTTSPLHAGSTNIESRWDWNWLGVCLVCCCFPT